MIWALVWGSSYQDIAVLQKKAVRAVTSAKYFAHTQPLFRKLDLLNIEDIYNQSILKFGFKLYNNDVPTYFFTFLKSIEDCCQHYNLRNTHIRTPVHFHSFF